MPSRRDQIRMSDEQLLHFLRSQKTLMLVSNGRDGYPHPMPMWFAVEDDCSVRMTTFRKSQKTLNIQRDPRVSLLAEDGEEYAELRGVVVQGHCEIVDDLEVVMDAIVDITGGDAANDPQSRAGMKQAIQATASKRVCLRIQPGRIVSWDHRKLAGGY